MIEIDIDGKKVRVEEGTTILTAAEELGIDIPILCYNGAVKPKKACRVCTVEVVRGEKTTFPMACSFKIKEPMTVKTNSEEALSKRREAMGELLKAAPGARLILDMAKDSGLDVKRDEKGMKCFRCGLCVNVCEKVIGKAALTFEKGASGTPYKTVNDNCIGCATCVAICPTNAIVVEDKGVIRAFPQGKKEFKLVMCKECGTVITTEAHIEYMKDKSDLPDDVFEVCAECKRASYSERVASGELISL